MNLSAKLAYSQLKTHKSRSLWTLAGIILSTAMLTAVSGFVASADQMFKGLLGESRYYSSMYNKLLYGLSAVFGFIIIAASVIVVSNAFRVSSGERIREFGTLKSVGATKWQIAGIILSEGKLLALISIPQGVALGLFTNAVGIEIMDHLLAAANLRNSFQVNFDFVFAWQAIIASVIFSFATVWLSAWLPARKAAELAAISAIRGTGEVSINASNLRGGKLIGRLFGFEGTLAYKSLKRNRRNFRATVISLTVSIVLFIVAGSFGAQYKEATRLYYPGVENVNVAGTFMPPEDASLENSEANEQQSIYLDSALADQIADKMREYPKTKVFGVGDNVRDRANQFIAMIPENILSASMTAVLEAKGYQTAREGYVLPVSLCITDAVNYAKLCKKAGVPFGSNILVNYARIPEEEGKSIFEPFMSAPQILRMTNQYDNAVTELPLDGMLDIRDVPNEIAVQYVGHVMVIVPHLQATRYTWFAEAADPEGYTAYAEKLLQEYITFEGSSEYIEVSNMEEVPFAVRDISRLIMIFIYGFVFMLTLIGLTNVISTLSANVRSRAREFAVLRSVGMTPAGLKRMLNLESILSSATSLAMGVPLGILGSYILYHTFMLPVEFEFAIPWYPILQCALGVVAITWVTMRYSASWLREDNIIETIRSE